MSADPQAWKPDWDTAPPWAEVLAMDVSGRWYWLGGGMHAWHLTCRGNLLRIVREEISGPIEPAGPFRVASRRLSVKAALAQWEKRPDSPVGTTV